MLLALAINTINSEDTVLYLPSNTWTFNFLSSFTVFHFYFYRDNTINIQQINI